MIRCAILSAGSGSVAQPLIDSAYFGEIPDFELSAVISSKRDSYALLRAKNAGFKTYVVERGVFPNDSVFLKALSDKLSDLDIDLVVLAGFPSDLGQSTLKKYSGRILEAVPARPGDDGVAKSAVIAVRHADDGREISRLLLEPNAGEKPVEFARRLVDSAGELLASAVRRYCSGELRAV